MDYFFGCKEGRDILLERYAESKTRNTGPCLIRDHFITTAARTSDPSNTMTRIAGSFISLMNGIENGVTFKFFFLEIYLLRL
jgi:hypothetical protein